MAQEQEQQPPIPPLPPQTLDPIPKPSPSSPSRSEPHSSNPSSGVDNPSPSPSTTQTEIVPKSDDDDPSTPKKKGPETKKMNSPKDESLDSSEDDDNVPLSTVVRRWKKEMESGGGEEAGDKKSLLSDLEGSDAESMDVERGSDVESGGSQSPDEEADLTLPDSWKSFCFDENGDVLNDGDDDECGGVDRDEGVANGYSDLWKFRMKPGERELDYGSSYRPKREEQFAYRRPDFDEREPKMARTMSSGNGIHESFNSQSVKSSESAKSTKSFESAKAAMSFVSVKAAKSSESWKSAKPAAKSYESWKSAKPAAKSSEPALVGARLENLGNTCYMNAILQCLTHTVPFVEVCLSNDSLQHGKYEDCPKAFCALNHLQSHMKKALRTPEKIIFPWNFANNVGKLSQSFVKGRQEDAGEFLDSLFEKLDDCWSKHPRKAGDVSEGKQESLLEPIFESRFVSQLLCPRCGYKSDSDERSPCLKLAINNEDSLESALETYTQLEKLKESSCGGCGEQLDIGKQLKLVDAPSVAAFQLKRFLTVPKINSDHDLQKIDKFVRYPLELDLGPYAAVEQAELKYELYAFVVHRGKALGFGHYVSFIRSGPETWFQISDSLVHRVQATEVLKEEAYILFYAKKGTAWPCTLLDPNRSWSGQQDISSNSPKSVLGDEKVTNSLLDATLSDDEATSIPFLADRSSTDPVINGGGTSSSAMGEEASIITPPSEEKLCHVLHRHPSPQEVTTPADDYMLDSLRSLSDFVCDDDMGESGEDGSTSVQKAASNPVTSFSIPKNHLKRETEVLDKRQVDSSKLDVQRREAIRCMRGMNSQRRCILQDAMMQSYRQSSSNKRKRYDIPLKDGPTKTLKYSL